MQRSWALYAFWGLTLILLAAALWYIARSPGSPPSTELSKPALSLKPEDYPKLDERLLDLIAAPNPATYAQDHGLEKDYKDGKVVVVIEAQSLEFLEELRWAIEALEGKLETEHELSLQARLPLMALLKLAGHPHIQFIRLPARAEPG